MKILKISILFILISSVYLHAQESRVTSGIEFGTGYKDKVWLPVISYHQDLSMNNFPWLRIGWGLRGSGFYKGRTDLVPQSSSLGGDTLKFGRISETSVSFFAGLTVKLWKLELGANTDLLNVAFGTTRRGLYSKYSGVEGEGAKYYNTYVLSNPAFVSVVPLALDKQNGQSDAFVRFWIAKRLGVKVGYLFGRITYTTAVSLDNGQKRFSTTYGVPYASISFPLYN